MQRIAWHWIDRFSEQFERCALRPGNTAVVLSETGSRPELVETSRLALEKCGAHVAEFVLQTPANPGPVPIRSTGASLAIGGHPAVIAGLKGADFVVDCTVEGLLHSVELGEILAAGTRILMISNEHPETYERMVHDPTLADRVAEGATRLRAASTMTATSAAGTDLSVSMNGAVVAGSSGYTTEPGDIAHWPGGLVLAFPSAGSTNGTIVLAPGDVNLTFKDYVRSTIRLTIENDYITKIDGDGLDAELFQSYLSAFDEADAYAVSHVGWGMNTGARWDTLPLWDKSQMNGTELRAFAGNFLYSTGANEVAGRFCRGHFDLPMRHHTVMLDGTPVVVDGQLVDELR